MSNESRSLIVVKPKSLSGEFLPDPATTSPFVSGPFGMASFHALRERLSNHGLQDIADKVANLRIPPSPATMQPVPGVHAYADKSIAEQLFDATAEVKILTSQVAMHLENEWRERLFSQLDRLHDPDEWDEEDRPVVPSSFSTFLKAICDLKPAVRPGLGLSNSGYLIAAWTSGKNRLTLQFMPHDRVKWVISRYPEGELDQVAGDTPVHRLAEALAPYNPNEWFVNAEVRPTAS